MAPIWSSIGPCDATRRDNNPRSFHLVSLKAYLLVSSPVQPRVNVWRTRVKHQLLSRRRERHGLIPRATCDCCPANVSAVGGVTRPRRQVFVCMRRKRRQHVSLKISKAACACQGMSGATLAPLSLPPAHKKVVVNLQESISGVSTSDVFRSKEFGSRLLSISLRDRTMSESRLLRYNSYDVVIGSCLSSKCLLHADIRH